MKKAFNQIKKYWLINLVTFLIAIVVGVAIFCLIFFLRNQTIIAAGDGAAIGSMVVIFLGLLMWVAHLGAFDTFAYGFKQMFTSFFAKNANKYNDMYSYKQAKIEKREHSPRIYFAMLFAAVFFVLAIIVLEIVYHIH